MQKTLEFLKSAGTYYLATVDGDQPRVRPFGTIHIYGGRLYIQTGRTKDVAKQILTNPKVELSAMNGNDWIRVCGTLVMDEDKVAQESMLDEYPHLRPMYTTGPEGNSAVFYFKDATATIYSFTGEPKVMKF